jgi:hypothetical protein
MFLCHTQHKYVMLSVTFINVVPNCITLNVIMPSVIALNVVAYLSSTLKAILVNIRLGCKGENTLAYWSRESVTKKKRCYSLGTRRDQSRVVHPVLRKILDGWLTALPTTTSWPTTWPTPTNLPTMKTIALERCRHCSGSRRSLPFFRDLAQWNKTFIVRNL